jgi:acetyl/propionyl-CoA carboxylase alpha subunit
MIQSILIANRGEIACRIIRACRKMGVWATAVYSEADRSARHVQLADEAVYIGAASATESYLNITKIIVSAQRVTVQT